MKIGVGDRVRTKTLKPKSTFNRNTGTVTKAIELGPFDFLVKFDEIVYSGGVPYEEMSFKESELERA